ncbi:hypothetical protein BIW11_11272, partial [Tropilaelaps mercedesae]
FAPFSVVQISEDGTADVWGSFIQIALDGAKYAGLKPSLVNAKAVPYGAKLENGSFTWGSAFGLLENGEALVFSGPSVVDEERHPIVESIEGIINSYQLLTWKPQKTIDPFAFMLAFTPEVWLCLGIMTIMLAALCTFIDRFLTPWRFPDNEYKFASNIWEFYRRLYPQ